MSKIKDNDLILIETEMIKLPTSQIYEDSTAGLIVTGTYTISADRIKDVDIDDSGKANGRSLTYNSITETLVYSDGSPFSGDIGVYGGGFSYTAYIYAEIDTMTISTTGSSQGFGNLTGQSYTIAGTSNALNDRGILSGGSFSGSPLNMIDYITITTPGDAHDFGNLTVARGNHGSTSNGTDERGVFGGGYGSSGATDDIDYITINSLSNADTFGLIPFNTYKISGVSNSTNQRGLFGGWSHITVYITINSLGNAENFGNLSVARRDDLAAASNAINDRALFAGGDLTGTYSLSNIIDYYTISTLSTADDFGDLTDARFALRGTSNGTNERAIFSGGKKTALSNSVYGLIDYSTINSLGNATVWGGLTHNKCWGGSTSNA
jgi:hypothetical protein